MLRSVTVRVLYFAALRDAVGLSEEVVVLPDGVRTVADLAAHLAALRPAYGERRAHVRVARNESFAEDLELVHDGDVIALIPPVAGG
jgi:molybdopterin converting factor subunit 1